MGSHTSPDDAHRLQAADRYPNPLQLPPLSDEEREKIADKFRDIVLARLPVYQTLAQEAGFWIELGDTTCYDHERRTIILNIDDFAGRRRNLDPSMVDYLILHKLGHLREMAEDPEGYRDILESGQAKYGDAAFRLYNCMMDIFVNTNTAQMAPVYGETFEPSELVKDFYRKQAFPNRDFSNRPECLQFAHYLLNLGMGAADDIILSPPVQKRIDEGLTDLTGQKMTYKDFVDLYMRPQVTRAEGSTWRGFVSQRKRIIDKMLRPNFESFLMEDLANGRAIEVTAIPGVGPLMPIQSIKKILGDAKEQKNVPGNNAADRETLEQLQQIGRDLDMPIDEVNDFARTFIEMRPTINALAALWDDLKVDRLYQSTAKAGYYVTGCDLDVQRAVSCFARIQTSPESADVMYRRVPEEQRIPAPCHFNLRLVIDTSGSMACFQEQVRKTAVALGASLYVKNTESTLQGDRLTCGLEVRRFSGRSETILPCTENLNIRELMVWYPQITMGGGTADHIALQDINRAITPAVVSKIRDGSQVEIVIEITDGDTCDSNATMQQLRAFEKKGVLSGAINLSGFTSGMFDQIWNRGPIKRGLYISKPEDLPEALQKMIKQFIAESPNLKRT